MGPEVLGQKKPQRIYIRFDRWYSVVSTALFLPPSNSFVEVDDEEVRVRMGWAFRARFLKTAVAAVMAEPVHRRPLSRGVHGFAGRWLVNGSGKRIVAITLNPAQRGYVLGFPVRLRELMVSVAEPLALTAALGVAA